MHIDLENYLDSLRLDRDILDVMIGGHSAMDTNISLMDDESGIIDFMRSYGYNLDDPIQSAELMGVYHEAIQFIKKHFLQPENPHGLLQEIPSYFLNISDLKKLIAYSLDKDIKSAERTHWTCAIMKVMHTIIHLDKDIRADYFGIIQQQIFDRFYKAIHGEENTISLGPVKSSESIPLVKFQTKPRKSRESQILKLLHKKENVAEDIYDQVGVRFVTGTRVDALRVLKYLRDKYIVIPGNIKPSRSRNSLINPFLYRRIWRGARFEARKDLLRSTGEIDAYIERALQGELTNQKDLKNPFTNNNYMAIQFTCRQLVKYRSSVFDDVKNLKNAIKESSDKSLKAYAERIDLTHIFREQAFFYPFEVQIMDSQGFEESQVGLAAHKNYKAAQVQQAMKRVLSPFYRKDHQSNNSSPISMHY